MGRKIGESLRVQSGHGWRFTPMWEGAGGDQLVCGHTAFSYLSAVIAYGVHDSVGSINQQLFRVELLLRSATDDCISQDVHYERSSRSLFGRRPYPQQDRQSSCLPFRRCGPRRPCLTALQRRTTRDAHRTLPTDFNKVPFVSLSWFTVNWNSVVSRLASCERHPVGEIAASCCEGLSL